MPIISIIIATSSRPAPLEETLRSLSSVKIPAGWIVELLLVENGSRLGAERLIAAFPRGGFQAVRYLFEPAPGKSRALNFALAQTRADILMFTDDDVRFPSDWLERMCAPIVEGRADAVAGGVRLAPDLHRPWMNHTHRAWLASTADYLSETAPSEMCGANMALSRRIFDQTGGFDPELGPGVTGGGEESLLTWQLKAAGFRLVGALDIQVEHHLDPGRLKRKSWIKAARLKGQARAYLMHHWHHQTIRNSWLKQLYFGSKLFLRRRLAGKIGDDVEGIAPWEISYIEDIAMFGRYRQERHRMRNYAYHGIQRLKPERQTVTL